MNEQSYITSPKGEEFLCLTDGQIIPLPVTLKAFGKSEHPKQPSKICIGIDGDGNHVQFVTDADAWLGIAKLIRSHYKLEPEECTKDLQLIPHEVWMDTSGNGEVKAEALRKIGVNVRPLPPHIARTLAEAYSA